ncbi:MAG: hypothetical protein ACLPVO_16470 [Desulfomonilaceae bacterium]
MRFLKNSNDEPSILINDASKWNPHLSANCEVDETIPAHYSDILQQSFCNFYEIPELVDAYYNQSLERAMSLGLTRFAVIFEGTWPQVGRLLTPNDYTSGGVAAVILDLMRNTKVPVIPAPQDTAFGLIERFLEGEELWIGDITGLPTPPAVGVDLLNHSFSLRGLESVVRVEQLKLIDFVQEQRNEAGYCAKLAKLHEEFPYLGCVYYRQGLQEDHEPVRLLTDFCRETSIDFDVPVAGSFCRWAREDMLGRMWQRFLSDVAAQFNKN